MTTQRTPILALVAALLLAAASLSAQAYPKGCYAFVVSPHSKQTWRLVGPGNYSYGSLPFFSVKDMMPYVDNRDLAVAGMYQQTPGLYRVAGSAGPVTDTMWIGKAESFCLAHTGDYVVAETHASKLITVKSDGSGSTLLCRLPVPHFTDILQDIRTGDYFGLRQGTLWRVAADGSSVGSIAVMSTHARCMAQDHTDGSLLINRNDGSLYRYHPVRKQWTIILQASKFLSGGGCVLFDRSPGGGEIAVANVWNTISRMDRTGRQLYAMTTYGTYMPAVCFEESLNLVSNRLAASNRWRIEIDFPAEGGRSYLLALSGTGFAPGIRLGTRTVALAPDALFRASLSGLLAPVLTGNAGRLDSRGHAAADLDLGRYGKVLGGVRLWAVAVTLDPLAPFGIATVSKPMVLVLD